MPSRATAAKRPPPSTVPERTGTRTHRVNAVPAGARTHAEPGEATQLGAGRRVFAVLADRPPGEPHGEPCRGPDDPVDAQLLGAARTAPPRGRRAGDDPAPPSGRMRARGARVRSGCRGGFPPKWVPCGSSSPSCGGGRWLPWWWRRTSPSAAVDCTSSPMPPSAATRSPRRVPSRTTRSAAGALRAEVPTSRTVSWPPGGDVDRGHAVRSRLDADARQVGGVCVG